MEFHGIPWNFKKSSMEFHGTFWGKIKSSMEFHGIPWNSGVWKKFHGIPWNFESGQNSMEFHGIPWNHRCCSNVVQKVPWNFGESSMELFDQKVSMSIEKRFWMIFWNSVHWWYLWFHWITKKGSMTPAVPWNSMEFNRTWSAPISTEAVPWNSMEFGISQFQWHEQFHGIPWNQE